MTKLQDEETREATTYVVQETFDKRAQTYLIRKIIMEVEADTYHVTIKPTSTGRILDDNVWCDCPGFRRQTYAKIAHKHIMLVLDYIAHGTPKTATYTIIGTGRKAKIKFLRGDNGSKK